jgi:predicted Kef-type K+ transport protein
LIKLKIKSKPILFTVFTLIEVLCLVVLSFVLSMMVEMGISFDSAKIINSIIMLCSLIILVCLGFGIGYFYIVDYFVSERFVISDFG